MNQWRYIVGAALLLITTGCEDTKSNDGGHENADDRTCESGDFLVTADGCGGENLGELTEFCVEGRWQRHSCNDPENWPDHDYASGYLTGCTGQIHYQRWATMDHAVANLVVLNGRTEYVDKYHHVIPMLKRPWDIIMFDNYGQGRSDGIRAHAVDFDTDQVCDFGKVLDNTINPDLPTFVLAHSMGAFIAVRHEQLYPGQLNGMVLTSPMFAIPTDPYTTEQAINMAKLSVEAGNAEVNYKEDYVRSDWDEWKLTHDVPLYEKYRRDPLTVIGHPTFGWLYAALTGMQALMADPAEIDIPILLFQAELDTVVLPEPQNAFCDRVANCERRIRTGDFHDLLSELDREEIVQETLQFLDDVLDTP